MSLVLNGPDTQREIEVKTWNTRMVYFDGKAIGIADFLAAAHYVLTNTYLTDPRDPRIAFIGAVRAMRVTREQYDGSAGQNARLTNGCDSIFAGHLFAKFGDTSLDAIGSVGASDAAPAPKPIPLRRAARRRSTTPAKRRAPRTR